MSDATVPAPGVPESGSGNAEIENVSDTALMVAACRALETERPDGLVCDPFARRLAGERGMAIARASPIPEWMCFGVGVRARFMDELLAEALAGGRIHTVVNLGAGLDTRPWRLALDPGLRWIEADFAAMLEYKAARLRDVPPRCRLEQVPANLTDGEARKGLFERIGATRALMITEGLLMYLPRAALLALAEDSHRLTGIRFWLLDAFSPDMMRMAAGEWKCPVAKFRPEDHLAGQPLLDAAVEAGWRISVKRTYARDGAAAAAGRVASLLESRKQSVATLHADADDISGIYLLTRPGV
jgi:methyltransferase (TIGR00027 family)